jgi:predicted metal-dependent hydrolase
MSAAKSRVHIDQLVRSRWRTVSLEIDQSGKLIVRAPLHASQAEIEALVEGKQNWILNKQRQAIARRLESPQKQFLPGEKFLFLGKEYPIKVVQHQAEPLVLNGAFLLVAKRREKARAVFESWYRQQAAQVIKPRTCDLAQQNGFQYQIIRINGAKTRWGSCGPKGSLNFAWRLVMAPPEIIDYVIIHELVHLRVRNHSKSYWEAVNQIMPDFKRRRTWLQKYGYQLSLD